MRKGGSSLIIRGYGEEMGKGRGDRKNKERKGSEKGGRRVTGWEKVR